MISRSIQEQKTATLLSRRSRGAPPASQPSHTSHARHVSSNLEPQPDSSDDPRAAAAAAQSSLSSRHIEQHS